jgi:hypothetical protein
MWSGPSISTIVPDSYYTLVEPDVGDLPLGVLVLSIFIFQLGRRDRKVL